MNFTSAKQNACLLLLATLCLSACEAPAGQEWKPTIGLSTTIVDNYEVDISALGYIGYSESFDYSMNELELGSTRVTPDNMRPIKHEFAGFKLGSGDLRDSSGSGDLDEFSGGGILYFDEGESLIPFLSIWATNSDFENPILSTQLGLRIGGGIEYPILGRNASITLGGDYLIPLIGAQDSTGIVELNGRGLAVRLGIRFVL